MGPFGSKYKLLDTFYRATLLFRDRVQVNLARDFRCGVESHTEAVFSVRARARRIVDRVHEFGAVRGCLADLALHDRLAEAVGGEHLEGQPSNGHYFFEPVLHAVVVSDENIAVGRANRHGGATGC